MGGRILEYQAKTIREKGIAEGHLRHSFHSGESGRPGPDDPGQNPGTIQFKPRGVQTVSIRMQIRNTRGDEG